GWNGELRADSSQALLYELCAAELPREVFGKELGARVSLPRTLEELEENPNPDAIERALKTAEGKMGGLKAWGDLHQVTFRHPLNEKKFERGPFPRPGDGSTVNATSGQHFQQTAGASYREIIDVADWDRSVTTNTPGESGDPESKHYDDLAKDWAAG